jgi:hypothetical protein
VVSLNDISSILLQDAQAVLITMLEAEIKDPLEKAFILWLTDKTSKKDELRSEAQSIAEMISPSTDYRRIAFLGFCADMDVLDIVHFECLQSALMRLAGREPIYLVNQYAPFVWDIVAQIGIALAAKAVKADKTILVAWYNKFCSWTYHGHEILDWQKCIIVGVQQILGCQRVFALPSSADVADVRVALYSKNFLHRPERSYEESEELESLRVIKRTNPNELTREQAAFRLGALYWITRDRPSLDIARPTPEQIGALLRRIETALQRWTWESKRRTSSAAPRKWYVDNEYHVQNLVWAILSPVFVDLTEEEVLAPIGQYQPRADICIPSLKLVIEIKFMRKDTSPRKLIEEIASDSATYLVSGSKYKNIIAFIWDDSRRVEEHEIMIRGMKQLGGVIDAVVISRPGIMDASENSNVTENAPTSETTPTSADS